MRIGIMQLKAADLRIINILCTKQTNTHIYKIRRKKNIKELNKKM
jgi:hypothetical protein